MTEADIIRLGLYKPQESQYIKIDDVTIENMSAHFWQERYKEALQVITNQVEYIKHLEEMNGKS